MNIGTGKWLVRAVVVVAALLGGAIANADVMVNDNVMVTLPSVPRAESLSLASAGTLTVTVADLLWPQALQSLSFAITNNQGVLMSMLGSGSLVYNATGPMTLFANVYAVPDSLAGVGLYRLNVSFAPSVVPLPAAAWLLLSGMCGIAALRRKHATVTNSVVQSRQ